MRKFILAAMLLIIAIITNAQERFTPYGYVQLHSGVSTVFTNTSLSKRISSTSSLSVGANLIPELGIRLDISGWESKGHIKSISESYKHNYINPDLDLLFNMTNIIGGYNSQRIFDLNLIAGIGLNYAWNGGIGETKYGSATENLSNKWGNGLKQTSFFGTQFRMGLQGDFKLCKAWSIGIEIDMNTLSDDFNAKYNQHNDWMLTAQASVSYKFGGSKKQTKPQEPTELEPVITEPEPEQVRIVEPEPEPEIAPEPVAEEPKPLYEVNSYAIRQSGPILPSAIDRTVEWCKANPGKKIVVEGYADKGTGNPQINMRYSQQRANKFAAALKQKGIPANQIEVKAYGDSIQPFSENDKNRCVIVKSL